MTLSFEKNTLPQNKRQGVWRKEINVKDKYEKQPSQAHYNTTPQFNANLIRLTNAGGSESRSGARTDIRTH